MRENTGLRARPVRLPRRQPRPAIRRSPRPFGTEVLFCTAVSESVRTSAISRRASAIACSRSLRSFDETAFQQAPNRRRRLAPAGSAVQSGSVFTIAPRMSVIVSPPNACLLVTIS